MRKHRAYEAYRANGTNGANRAYEAHGTNGAHRAHGANGLLGIIVSFLCFFIFSVSAQAQAPKIGGNVYGGGNKANVGGSTKVTVKAGDIGAVEEGTARPVTNPRGRVFGGARMANVGGNTFVHINGEDPAESSADYIVVNQVYGGNDIAGQIGTAAAVNEPVPSELTAVKRDEADATNLKKNDVDDTFNSYVRVSTRALSTTYTAEEIAAAADNPDDPAYGKSTTDVKPDPSAKKIYIGQLFGGGNGDFDYASSDAPGGKVTHTIYNRDDHTTPIAQITTEPGEVGFHLPEQNKTYLEVVGGSIVYAYGGGNNATVKEKTIIHVDNPSAVVNHVLVDADGNEGNAAIYTAYENYLAGTGSAPDGYTNLLTNERFKEMGINTVFSKPSSGAFQIGRFFGGNNKAEMAIRPTWNLLSGKVRNLYSGGNQGNMTCSEGLLLEIPDYSTLIVDNLYGGCRMADVVPTVDGVYTPCPNLPGYNFPNEMSARVLVKGGHINNVFGGNDVTGTVYGGNAIGIYTTVYGDVYGGGNGNYPYTDIWDLRNNESYGDLYYGKRDVQDFAFASQTASVDALNAYRPHAEQVSLRLWGKSSVNPTIIKGSVFVGGNCASLDTKKQNPRVELKIGSNVIADKVFLGNNGEGMVDESHLQHYANAWPDAPVFSTLKLTNKNIFAEYMEGVCMDLQPSIVFDNRTLGDPDSYVDNSSLIGSFFCGGNVGSMAIPGKNSFRGDRKLIIFDKFVGGCNNANVAEGTYNAAYEGGILGAKNERGDEETQFYTDSGAESGEIKDRLEVTLDNLTLMPMRWNATKTDLEWDTQKWGDAYIAYETGTELAVGDKYYIYNSSTHAYEEQTVASSSITADGTQFRKDTGFHDVAANSTDTSIRLTGANIYGGCYNSGHVNGNVIFNINEDLVYRDDIFGTGTNSLGYPKSGVDFLSQRDDVMSIALTVFGAGYGQDTEIWGKTTMNLNDGYAFQIFGGGQEGVVGKKNGSGEYAVDERYSTYVNLKGSAVATDDDSPVADLAEAEYLYGGGNEGLVCGSTHVNLGNGRIYDAFGGSTNANILGHTEVYIGRQPDGSGGYRQDVFPWIRDIVYGGNDFGGTIEGSSNFSYVTSVTPTEMITSASTYVRYLQGHVGESIFGGNYGSYDYRDRIYQHYTNDDGAPKPGFSFPHLNNNSFVHFAPVDNANNAINGSVFGGSEGFAGHPMMNNTMQEESYVLVEDRETKDADRFSALDFYGGGNFAGLGNLEAIGGGRTVVDLYAGRFHNIYGGSHQEGLIGFTRVNVPAVSTANVNAIFGGGKGYEASEIAAQPALAARLCDHYVTLVDYQSEDALVNDAIYGGNHNCRIAFDTYVNIQAPVYQTIKNGYTASVYGGGYGAETVSGRTNVYMNDGANAYKVYGGGRDGSVYNFESLKLWLAQKYALEGGDLATITGKVKTFGGYLMGFRNYIASKALEFPSALPPYEDNMLKDNNTGEGPVDLVDTGEYYNTNVHIMPGGEVGGYVYGGGHGSSSNVGGTTYVELKGGIVDKDIYGGGEGGHVWDKYNLASLPSTRDFVANTNVYIEGGTARNVYGGGYDGNVGSHDGDDISSPFADDRLAVTNVIIGKADGTSFADGIPSIQRNAYGGGEGGSVYGTSNITINNGYIGYRYKSSKADDPSTTDFDERYVEELDDQTPNAIEGAGNVFGGGYVVNSYVDVANVNMYGGIVRGCLYGGGEVGPIGAGTTSNKYGLGGIDTGKVRIYRAGKTNVKMYDGWVKRNVFGGGRGQDSWGGDGTKFMNADVVSSLKTNGLFAKGYVFGQTEVNIYGGEVGTDDGVARGYGNVFGGGDIGFVYSAYKNASGNLCIGKKPSGSVRYDGAEEGYYYKYEKSSGDTHTFLTDGDEKILTEDCKVLVEPWCKANSAVTISDQAFAEGVYVPTSYLNYLGNKTADAATWTALGKTDVNKEGIIIHNAVFAGGNTSPGSTEVYANTATVFGNATASIHDVYNRDLISIGRGRVGGLYGDGNLTLVDGYRELNITNYGTDFYHIKDAITLSEYEALPKREQAYYEIRYKCLQPCVDNTGKSYAVNSTITADEMLSVFEGVYIGGNTDNPMLNPDGTPNSAYWEQNGVLSRYAGRPMNTIQRSDFCGIFGSRMVMQGAQDRVPEIIDYTNYTINRVREVSLNKVESKRSEDAGDARNQMHGNYFGIYSVVNFLGALTSDVDFHDAIRSTDNSDVTTYQANANGKEYGTATFFDWKKEFHDEQKRNNGNSYNKVALASGVYLELTTEKSTGSEINEKDWGYITGVVELDLINVQPGVGGGYVYAKNEHGTRDLSGNTHTILSPYNMAGYGHAAAVTNRIYKYDDTISGGEHDGENCQDAWETSGNFVHSTLTIIDDCYNMGGKYKVGESPVPAHYWFIKGSIYIYDQYISAFTGSPNAYSEVVSIPLTITSASHGQLKLLNVQQNRYAYYSVNSNGESKELDADGKIELRETEYKLNDAINYWDWSLLASNEKKLFVEETYLVTADCTYGTGDSQVTYKAGTVLLPGDENEVGTYYYLKEQMDSVYHVGKRKNVPFEEVFRPSNNVSHNTGYMLTYTINNPSQWNTWYTDVNSATHQKDQTDDPTVGADEDGPTYTPKASGLYGQNDYVVGNIIAEEVYNTYNGVNTAYIPNYGLSEGDEGYDASKKQAKFYPAYVVTADVLETTNKKGTAQRFHKGATLSKEDYSDAQWSAMTGSVELAYMVTNTLQLSKTEYLYRNTYLTAAEKTTLYGKFHYDGASAAEEAIAAEINKCVVPAYYCTEAGRYGGNYYQKGYNYRGLATFSSFSKEDRDQFDFNYDAFDLLIDPSYGGIQGQKYQYDSAAATLTGAESNSAQYSLPTPIDYSATYQGTGSLSYIDDNNAVQTATQGKELSRTEYERLANEQYYWAPITVTDNSKTYYVVKETMVLGDIPYAAGQVISQETYDGLSGNVDNADTEDDGDKANVLRLTLTSSAPAASVTTPVTYYYCREGYTIPSNDDGHAVTSTSVVTGGTGGSYNKGVEVPTGVIIDSGTYGTLTNNQKNFTIHGLAPTETSTLYVARGSDINDLSAEKIITVVYQYDYVESDMSGMHITPVSERHVLNIHLSFKSGIPTVEDINAPEIILPGTTITIPEPYVTPGAYEITGAGWKLFDSEPDAESHMNGVDYTPVSDPLYLYQNKHYLAYYAKTALGETYSNYVPVSVANYHDLKKVMDDKDNHYYIDHKEIFNRLKVDPKIYINNYSGSSENGLDLLKNLYDLSVISNPDYDDDLTVDGNGRITNPTTLTGHKLLNTNVTAGKHLEFFLRTDIDHSSTSWTPIARQDDPATTEINEDEPCFQGTFHGDGHTLSGLDHSLFGKLCGKVYNLGVTGSFTGAGVVDTGDGYVENCWINTTGTPDGSVYAVFGEPTRGAGEEPIQVVNSYYQDGKNYKTTATNHGMAKAKPDLAFYNGEVAYDLNGFYLYKRYCDKQVSSGTEDQSYSYYTIDGATNKPVLQEAKYYGSHPEYCSSGFLPETVPTGYEVPMYVEDRFADGDFRYAAGSIPASADERLYVNPDDETDQYFFPIWPDDYIFFGQMLTYGWGLQAHQNVPTAVTKSGGRLSQTPDANRVYRAPAYYRSKTMGMAHFNPNVYLAQRSADGTREAYPGMTAIDFAGHNDVHDETSDSPIPYSLGWNGDRFYTPLLDDDGLLSIVNVDETRNLLVYAPKEEANAKTHSVLTSYFSEPAYADYYDETAYRIVTEAPTASIYGHLVMDEPHATATNDHLLVDKQDFNCPIEYEFASGKRMWYQRKPDHTEFVNLASAGWQGISVPFTAELVTTSQKGEITHFYSGSLSSKNDQDAKIGHEYWLRELNNITDTGDPSVVTANFNYPAAAGETKEATNTFLWDYYYSKSTRKDANSDIYQQYYSSSRSYPHYSLLATATPYIIGFPGEDYYEFDLSGSFIPQNTYAPIDRLDKQVISFVSNPAVTIGVSDDEIAGKVVNYGGNDYTFMPSYKNVSLNGNDGTYFTLDAAGDSYDKLAAATTPEVSAFRPYFIATASGGAKEFRGMTRSIAFSTNASQMYVEEEEDDIDAIGQLIVRASKGKIIVSSTLAKAKDVTIVTATGSLLNRFTIQPGETVETPVTASGIYVVNKKKLSVKIKE